MGIPDNSVVYLDTSAVNYLYDNRVDPVATKFYHIKKNTRFYISSTTLWEILMTKDSKHRDNLLLYLQQLAYPKLINSPSEFIINYIKSGYPIEEQKYDFHSKLKLQEDWEYICKDLNRKFSCDVEELNKRRNSIIEILKEFNNIKDITIFSQFDKDIITSINEKNKKSLLYFFIFLLLVLGVDFDSTPAISLKKEIMSKNNIIRDMDYFKYICNKYHRLTEYGPFVMMSEIAFSQIGENGSIPRGMFLDALHGINITYCDWFLTNDKHFYNIRNTIKHPSIYRIKYIPSLTVTKHSMLE